MLRSDELTSENQPKLPQSENILHGEIAINYKAGVETLSIKNSDDEIVSMPINGMLQDVASALAKHESRNDNPHSVTKEQVGLGNVDNTADIDKPISVLQQEALDEKLNNAENGGIANNLTTNASNIALSAAMGIELNNKLDSVTEGTVGNLQALEVRVASIEEEISGSTEYIEATLMPLAQNLHNTLTI